MTRKFLITLLCISFLSLGAVADDFKIINIDKEGIRIGETIRHKGDLFNDNEPIHWSSRVKSFKAKNLATSKLKVFSENQNGQNESKSPEKYYTNLVGLSGRNPFTLDDLGEWLNDTFVLESQIVIPTEERIDDEHYFILILSNGDEETACRLPVTPGRLIIDASLFEGLETDTVQVSVDYINVAKNGAYRLTDSMMIILWDESKEVSRQHQEE